MANSLIKSGIDNVIYTIHSDTSSLYSESYKFNDGRMIINMRYKVSTAVISPSGSNYYADITMPNFPITFYAKPTVSMHVEAGTGNAFLAGKNYVTTTSCGNCFIVRSTGYSTEKTFIIHVHAEGRWKE